MKRDATQEKLFPSSTIPPHPLLNPYLDPPLFNLLAINPPKSSGQHIPRHNPPNALGRPRQYQVIFIQGCDGSDMAQQGRYAKQHERGRVVLAHNPIHGQVQRNSVRIRDQRLRDEVRDRQEGLEALT